MTEYTSEEQQIKEEQQERLKKAMAKDAKIGRKLSGVWQIVVSILGALMVIFYFYSVGVEPPATQFNRGVYVLLTYVMILLSFPFRKGSNQKRPTSFDVLLSLISLACIGYFMFEYASFNYRSGNETALDMWVSIIGILLSLEVCRRVLGWSMTLVGIFFLIYGIYGPHFPGPFGHRGFDPDRLAVSLWMEQNGVFGIMASVLVTYVILFIFFGSFLQKSGVGKFFIDWPLALAGRTVGGPAKVSVIASAFFGSVSGSAIANTVSTGSFTIPLMKRAGFRPHVAGAIEPSASIGGMFMPPIMGAGGFLMAELTNTPYVDIMKMAIFPAALYFFSVLSMIHFEAKKLNIRGFKDEELPKARNIFKKHWYKSLPLVIIVAMMLAGFSPGMSAFWATISCIGISWFDPEHRMLPDRLWLIGLGFGGGVLFSFLADLAGAPTFIVALGGLLAGILIMSSHPLDRKWVAPFWEAVVAGSRSTLVIGATVGVIGIIVGTIALTGIGLKFSDIIFNLSQGILPLAILFIGLASLVLGMGVPVTAAYLITAVLAVPAISKLLIAAGIDGHTAASAALASHMIVYWFSQDSNITPPVCVAEYAGAAIAGSDPWKTGWTAFKFAKLLYVVPFLFAYEPGILLFGTWNEILLAFFSATVGTLAFSSLTMGYLIRRTTVLEWIVFAFGTFLCFNPKFTTDLIGIAIVGMVFFWQRYKNKRDERALLQVTA